MFGSGSDIEGRPERGPRRAELVPVDRFAELMDKLTEGRRHLVSADIGGMEDEFREVMEERGFVFEVISPEKSGGGPNYEVQRANLVTAFGGGEIGEERVAALEQWGERLFDEAGRGTHDHSTHKKGVAIPQVVLDLYRFAARLRTQDKKQNNDRQRAVETAEKLNERVRNWNGGGKDPSPCSGEMIAKVVDWMLTGEMK